MKKGAPIEDLMHKVRFKGLQRHHLRRKGMVIHFEWDQNAKEQTFIITHQPYIIYYTNIKNW